MEPPETDDDDMGDEAEPGQLLVDEPVAPAHRWWRRHLMGVVVIVGFALLAAWGIGAWVTRPHAPDYSGKTIAVTFDYDCFNSIGWQDPKTHYYWWAGDTPVLPADLETSPPTATPTPPPMRHARGQLHFDSEKQATFTSDAGGQLVLTRQPLNQMYVATCGVIP